ncbi:hypothetical protein Tco_0243217 [Tanacetum coccineum]
MESNLNHEQVRIFRPFSKDILSFHDSSPELLCFPIFMSFAMILYMFDFKTYSIARAIYTHDHDLHDLPPSHGGSVVATENTCSDVVGMENEDLDGDGTVNGGEGYGEVIVKVQSCPFGCNYIYTELKKDFDNLEVQYKECFIQVQAYKSSLQNFEQQKSWYQNNQLALEEKIRILTADLGNTTNMLKYTEKLNEQAKLDKMNNHVKLEESNARFDKWKE